MCRFIENEKADWRASCFRIGILLLALPAMAPADPLGAGGGAVFRMGGQSSFQEGCFPPCMCPITVEQPVLGTFKLVYSANVQGIHTYAVEDVNWKVPEYEPARRIIGTGKYSIGSPGPITVIQHRMELDLKVGDDDPQHFDSGWVNLEGNSGIDITVSINGMFCWDRVIVIDAHRVPPSDITPYGLDPGSTFQRGCFDPCECPLGPEIPMTGPFALVRVTTEPANPVQEYAVVDVDWRVLANSNASGIPIDGHGFYRNGGEVAQQHQMSLDLVVGTEPQTHFDSGWISGGGQFPLIDVVVSIHNMFCYDTVLHIVASPRGGQTCGGITGIPCPPGEFCKLPEGHCCCDFFGVCTPIPQGCPPFGDPVCGCDGVTYGNECEADAAGVSVDYRGECQQSCFSSSSCGIGEFCKFPTGDCGTTGTSGHCTPRPNACPDVWDPVCGCDDVTYGNECEADAAGVSLLHDGPCGPVGACCLDIDDGPIPYDTCRPLSEEACAAQGGVFSGSNAGCAATQGCCLGSGNAEFCADLHPTCCTASGGVPQGPGSNCEPQLTFCAGFIGLPCPDELYCVDIPDSCDPNAGGADCSGVCVYNPSEPFCGGIAGPQCPQGFTCVDLPTDECDPANGGADCLGVCLPEPDPCGEVCGGFAGIPCDDPDEFCKLPVGSCCCDHFGECTPIPQSCPAVWDPVCGCDGVTYGNECEADAAGVSIDHVGPCEPSLCSARRVLDDPMNVYCGGVTHRVRIILNPPNSASAISIEDSPPPGWVVGNISNGGVYDATNHKVKWGPLFPPFPPELSYAATPSFDANGPQCFAGTISVDGINASICGDQCLDGCCPRIPADLPQDACADCPVAGCTSCNAGVCGDARVTLCELVGSACAWLHGCHDDIAGLTRAAYIWRNGECYCWDDESQNWHVTGCDASSTGCCGDASGGLPRDAGREGGAIVTVANLRDDRAAARPRSLIVSVTIEAPFGASAAALEMNTLPGWKVASVSDGGEWDVVRGKVKWGPFFNELSRTVQFEANQDTESIKRNVRGQNVRGPIIRGVVSFDGVNVDVEAKSGR